MSANGANLATKKDLADGLANLKSELLEAIQEAIHDSETRLLKAIYAYAESAQKHFADLDQSTAALRERLGSIENRLTDVEKRLNMPPTS